MTPIDAWLMEHAPMMGLLLVIAVFGTLLWVRSGGIVDVKKNLSNHIDADVPHKPCNANELLLTNIGKQLDKLDETITTIDKRVYEIHKNGKK